MDTKNKKLRKNITIAAAAVLIIGALFAFPAFSAPFSGEISGAQASGRATYSNLGEAAETAETVTEEVMVPAVGNGKLEAAGYGWWDDYDFTYDYALNAIILNEYKGSDTEITVPATANIGGTIYRTVISKPTHNTGGVWYPVHDTLKSITFENGVQLDSDISYLFYNQKALVSADLSGLKGPENTSMISAFYGCSSLKNVNLSGFNTSKVTSMTFAFYGCSSLESIDLSPLDTSSVKVMSDMFGSCSSLKSIDLSSLDVSSVTSMSGMFLGCSSLSSVKLSGIDTSKVASMVQMFYQCTSLKTVDLSGLDITGVKKMDQMFSGCTALTGVNYSGLDFSGVESMDSMFFGCTALKKLDLSGLDLSGIQDMDDMFYNCTGLSTITLGTQNTKSLGTMTRMFQNCRSLTTVNLSGLDTSSLKFAYGLFSNCSKLETVSMKGFDFGNATSSLCANSMFTNCKSLKNVYAPVGLDADSALPYGMCDAAGNGYEALPKNLTSSVLLKRLDAPVLNVPVNKAAGVSLSWKKTAPAGSYRVYRKLSGTSVLKKWKDVTGTTCIDDTAESGKSYVYTVSPLSKDGTVEIGGMSETGVEKLFIATPQVNAPTSAAAGVRVAWPTVKGAAKYVILRSVGSGQPDWKYLATVAAGKESPQVYVDSSSAIQSGTWYAYTIRAIGEDGKTYSGQTAGKAIKYLAPVEVTNAVSTATGVRVIFTSVNGGYTYRLYRSVKGSSGTYGSYTAVTDLPKVYNGKPESVWIYDTTAKSGTTYRYYVRCVSRDGSVALSSYKNIKEITYKK